MIVSHDARFVFIAVNKTASSSIHTALRGCGFPSDTIGKGLAIDSYHHATADQVRQLLTQKQWGRYFKFAFVRNPRDRLVSYYHYFRFSPWVREDKTEARASETFKDWIRRGHYPRLSQGDMITCDGRIAIDLVGRFETLSEDFNEVCQRIGVFPDLPHINAHTVGDYREHYDVSTYELTLPVLEVDAHKFGYSFDR